MYNDMMSVSGEKIFVLSEIVALLLLSYLHWLKLNIFFGDLVIMAKRLVYMSCLQTIRNELMTVRN